MVEVCHIHCHADAKSCVVTGAIYTSASDNTRLDILSTRFVNDMAPEGGAVHTRAPSSSSHSTEIINSVFEANKASNGNGGGEWMPV